MTWETELQASFMNKSEWTVDLEGGATVVFTKLNSNDFFEIGKDDKGNEFIT